MLVSTAGSLRDIGHIHASAVKIVQGKIQPLRFKWVVSSLQSNRFEKTQG